MLTDLERSGRDEAVSVGDVLDRYQQKSLGVLLAVFGLIVILPIIGDIPGAAMLCATLVLISLAQSLIGRGGLWAPRFIRRLQVGRERFDRAIEKARPWARWGDWLLQRRLTGLVAGRANRIAVSVVAGMLALSLYPLALVPFGANAPGSGLLALGLGLMAGDGLLVLIGYLMAAVTVTVLLAPL